MMAVASKGLNYQDFSSSISDLGYCCGTPLSMMTFVSQVFTMLYIYDTTLVFYSL